MGYFYKKENPDDEKGLRKVTRSNSTFEEESFPVVMKAAKLPYVFFKKGKSGFIIEKIKN